MANNRSLNVNTLDIMNGLRAQASEAYQKAIPVVRGDEDIRRVGEIFHSMPELHNEYIYGLTNKVVEARVTGLSFTNPLSSLKKGRMTGAIEDIFVELVKATTFDPYKSAERSFQRRFPNIKKQIFTFNYIAQYGITVDDFRSDRAFVSVDAHTTFINTVIERIHVSAERDEFELFKYLMIKGVTKGNMYIEAITDEPTAMVKKYRGYINRLPFISNKYNLAGVDTTSKLEDQYLFVNADVLADLDVDVLARAYNMNKTDFLGHVIAMPDWDYFNNDLFANLTADGQFDPVTQEELNIMKKVRGLLIDQRWFQVYDGIRAHTVQDVPAGLYKNHFLTVEYSVNTSIFSNAIAFMVGDVTLPEQIEYVVTSVEVGNNNVRVVGIRPKVKTGLFVNALQLTYTDDDVEAGRIIEPYGFVTYTKDGDTSKLKARLKDATYTTSATVSAKVAPGATITFVKDVE